MVSTMHGGKRQGFCLLSVRQGGKTEFCPQSLWHPVGETVRHSFYLIIPDLEESQKSYVLQSHPFPSLCIKKLCFLAALKKNIFTLAFLVYGFLC